MQTIIYPTTINFNPGDEIIYLGVRELIRGIIGDHTPIYWNRHPGIRPLNATHDYSFDPSRHCSFKPDYVVFAGSPGWYGSGVYELYKWMIKTKTRGCFIGIGSSKASPKESKLIRKLLNECIDFVSCRDTHTAYVIAKMGFNNTQIYTLPCPSIFHSKNFKVRTEKKVIGLNYQNNRAKWQEAGQSQSELVPQLYQQLKNNYDIRVYCHFIDDLQDAKEQMPNADIYFSASPHDLINWFKEVDVMIGPRVHGCLGAMSTGAVAILTGVHDNIRRKGIAEHIPVLIKLGNEVEDIVTALNDLEAAQTSQAIQQWLGMASKDYADIKSQLSLILQNNGQEPKIAYPKSKMITIYRKLIDFLHRLPYAFHKLND